MKGEMRIIIAFRNCNSSTKRSRLFIDTCWNWWRN